MTSKTTSAKRLGVVLGGGGARGIAHVGVLQALADVDLHPDVIVGVSMGAVVGATYAARTDWFKALSTFDRSALPGHESLVDLEGFDLLRAVLRSAIKLAPKAVSFTSAGYEEFGRDVMGQLLQDVETFEQLRIPFAAVATDVAKGRRAVLTDGPVADAVIASAALPILTRPIEAGESRFLDGGFADPAPIDVARQMGADVVLMVHVGNPPSATTDEAEGPILGMLRGLEVGLNWFVEARLKEADVVVVPTFADGISWMSFDRADEAAEVGRLAMRERLPALHDALHG